MTKRKGGDPKMKTTVAGEPLLQASSKTIPCNQLEQWRTRFLNRWKQKRVRAGFVICLVVVIALFAVLISFSLYEPQPSSQSGTSVKPAPKPGDFERVFEKSIYSVYVPSYLDSNGDGIGDIKGLISKVPHIKSHGFGSILISLLQNAACENYPDDDITDLTGINSLLGSMNHFEELVETVHQQGMSLFMELEINHVSAKEHDWFADNVTALMYFVWKNGARESSRSNWMSQTGGSAWTFDSRFNLSYLHLRDRSVADLNYGNFEVVDHLKEVLAFWLGKGLDGVVLLHVDHLAKRGSLQVVKEFTQVAKGVDKVVLTYRSGPGTIEPTGAHADLSVDFIEGLGPSSTCQDFLQKVRAQLNSSDWPAWVSGSSDTSRLKQRLGDLSEAFRVVQFLLPGFPVSYYGEEIGMIDCSLTYNETKDPYALMLGREGYEAKSRDPFRTPMQWSWSKYAAFSEQKPFLPVHPNYQEVNVEKQSKTRRRTPLSNTAILNLLRKQYLYTDLISLDCEGNLFYFVKKGPERCLLVLANFGTPLNVDPSSLFPGELQKLVVEVATEKPIPKYLII